MRALRLLAGPALAAALVVAAPAADAAPTTSNPFGVLDELDANAPGGVRFRGWLIDPDTTAPIRLEVRIDGAAAPPVVADRSRPDVGAAYPGFGSAHGFDAVVPVTGGTHSFCMVALNAGPGADTAFGCGTIVRNANPFGVVDGISLQPGGVRATGWAIDPDTTGPISMRFTVDGVAAGAEVRADRARPDVGTAHPLFGPNHGYEAFVPVGDGHHQLCLIGVNAESGADTVFGCGSVTRNASPFGVLDEVTLAPGGFRVRGWVIDGDTVASTSVRVDVDGVTSRVLPADRPRPDVGAAHPAYGQYHGYDGVIPVAVGLHNFCVRAVNLGPGADVLFACGTVTRAA